MKCSLIPFQGALTTEDTLIGVSMRSFGVLGDPVEKATLYIGS